MPPKRKSASAAAAAAAAVFEDDDVDVKDGGGGGGSGGGGGGGGGGEGPLRPPAVSDQATFYEQRGYHHLVEDTIVWHYMQTDPNPQWPARITFISDKHITLNYFGWDPAKSLRYVQPRDVFLFVGKNHPPAIPDPLKELKRPPKGAVRREGFLTYQMPNVWRQLEIACEQAQMAYDNRPGKNAEPNIQCEIRSGYKILYQNADQTTAEATIISVTSAFNLCQAVPPIELDTGHILRHDDAVRVIAPPEAATLAMISLKDCTFYPGRLSNLDLQSKRFKTRHALKEADEKQKQIEAEAAARRRGGRGSVEDADADDAKSDSKSASENSGAGGGGGAGKDEKKTDADAKREDGDENQGSSKRRKTESERKQSAGPNDDDSSGSFLNPDIGVVGISLGKVSVSSVKGCMRSAMFGQRKNYACGKLVRTEEARKRAEALLKAPPRDDYDYTPPKTYPWEFADADHETDIRQLIGRFKIVLLTLFLDETPENALMFCDDLDLHKNGVVLPGGGEPKTILTFVRDLVTQSNPQLESCWIFTISCGPKLPPAEFKKIFPPPPRPSAGSRTRRAASIHSTSSTTQFAMTSFAPFSCDDRDAFRPQPNTRTDGPDWRTSSAEAQRCIQQFVCEAFFAGLSVSFNEIRHHAMWYALDMVAGILKKRHLFTIVDYDHAQPNIMRTRSDLMTEYCQTTGSIDGRTAMDTSDGSRSPSVEEPAIDLNVKDPFAETKSTMSTSSALATSTASTASASSALASAAVSVPVAAAPATSTASTPAVASVSSASVPVAAPAAATPAPAPPDQAPAVAATAAAATPTSTTAPLVASVPVAAPAAATPASAQPFIPPPAMPVIPPFAGAMYAYPQPPPYPPVMPYMPWAPPVTAAPPWTTTPAPLPMPPPPPLPSAVSVPASGPTSATAGLVPMVVVDADYKAQAIAIVGRGDRGPSAELLVSLVELLLQHNYKPCTRDKRYWQRLLKTLDKTASRWAREEAAARFMNPKGHK